MQMRAPELHYKDDFSRQLIAAVPGILATQDPTTGRFGEGIWIVNDQHSMYPLATAWALNIPGNPYFRNPDVLRAVVAAGDTLIEDADETGQWVFRKKDGSTWGKIHMPWTYSRWVRAFGLIRDAMQPEYRERWEKALILGYTGIAADLPESVHNIPAHNAMGLYIAGQLFDHADWQEQGSAYLAKVTAAQDPGGFWSEHSGPVVMYNFVYVDALGTYYAVSGDEIVRPALERSAQFHSAFTYPDGAMVETVDERNPYSGEIPIGNVGFTFSPEGRGFLAQQLAIREARGSGPAADALASYILYGEEGPLVPTAAGDRDRAFITSDSQAMVRRKGAWFMCLSAYCCPVPQSRWMQDRQNLVSIYHDKCGLILGGGNTKLQPLWSSFTVGDTALLKHTPGDQNPKFTPNGPLYHVPSSAALSKSDPPALSLQYGPERCEVKLELIDDSVMHIRLRAAIQSDQPAEAHLTLIPHMGQPLSTEHSGEQTLSDESFKLGIGEAGEWLRHGGWRISLPPEASITWPVLPHNPYTKDGFAKVSEGRIVVTLPFSADRREYELEIRVMEA